MINANHLLRELLQDQAVDGVTHKKLVDLLSGIKGKFSPKDIRVIRKHIAQSFLKVDRVLAKLENE